MEGALSIGIDAKLCAKGFSNFSFSESFELGKLKRRPPSPPRVKKRKIREERAKVLPEPAAGLAAAATLAPGAAAKRRRADGPVRVDEVR